VLGRIFEVVAAQDNDRASVGEQCRDACGMRPVPECSPSVTVKIGFLDSLTESRRALAFLRADVCGRRFGMSNNYRHGHAKPTGSASRGNVLLFCPPVPKLHVRLVCRNSRNAAAWCRLTREGLEYRHGMN